MELSSAKRWAAAESAVEGTSSEAEGLAEVNTAAADVWSWSAPLELSSTSKSLCKTRRVSNFCFSNSATQKDHVHKLPIATQISQIHAA